jgi:hypothetical protein
MIVEESVESAHLKPASYQKIFQQIQLFMRHSASVLVGDVGIEPATPPV